MITQTIDTLETPLTKKDFTSDQTVRWCPGCGDYAVLSAVQKTLADLQLKKEEQVFISGIGCSSRFPYYMETYGFHTIHGRALAVATGVKLANPELTTWVVTGDGDSLAIGGNHLIHTMRRNVDLNILMFNNRIYGLTKGQYSPASPQGIKTPTTPEGAIEEPFNAGLLTMGAGGSFFARVADNDVKLLSEMLARAVAHKGAAFIEILQNCVIFNDGIHDEITSKDKRDENQIILRHGEPMVFGKTRDKGLRFNGGSLEVINIANGEYSINDVLIHDESLVNPNIHMQLATMKLPDFPVAAGVIRAVPSPAYNEVVKALMASAREKARYKNCEELFNSEGYWTVQ